MREYIKYYISYTKYHKRQKENKPLNKIKKIYIYVFFNPTSSLKICTKKIKNKSGYLLTDTSQFWLNMLGN